jgi:hypothetical protein
LLKTQYGLSSDGFFIRQVGKFVPMTIYDEMQGIATELLTEFKQGIISYVKTVPGNGPVDDPGNPTITRYSINGTASGVQFRYVQNGLALASDKQVIAPVDSRYTPNMKDNVEVDGLPYKIVQIVKKPDAGTPVAYLLILRL